jgi:hypothetical protein
MVANLDCPLGARLSGFCRTTELDDRVGVLRPRGIRRYPASFRFPSSDTRCAEPSIRCGPRRVARPLEARLGRHRRAAQAPHLCGRKHRYAGRRRHHAPAHRIQGHDERLILKDLAEKTHRGLRRRIEDGKSGDGLCYGYRIVKALNGGTVTTGEREIEPAESALVERMFREFVEGVSPKQIAKNLNREGVSGPFGGPWSPSTIYGNAKRETAPLTDPISAILQQHSGPKKSGRPAPPRSSRCNWRNARSPGAWRGGSGSTSSSEPEWHACLTICDGAHWSHFGPS